MIAKRLVAAAALFTCGCVSAPPSQPASSSEVGTFRVEVKRLQEENTLLDLKLQDEIERGTIQVFLMRQEITAAKRETAAVQARCQPAP